jgi:TRAP-type transport system periplasmic protein
MLRLLLGIAVACVCLLGAADASAAHTLRVGTLAPKNSAWGKVFSVWQKAIHQKTNGELELKVFYNAVQGNEDSMVGKMKTGQLDGAALTSVGLSRIERDVLVLQLPGVVDSWSALDKVRGAVGGDLEARFVKKGFLILGWGDVGLVRQMTKGFALRRPSDLRGHRPIVWRNEPIGPTIYGGISGVVPVPLGPVEVLPALRAGKVDVVNAPALAAEQLQWTPFLDHVSDTTSVCAIGATVFRKSSLDALPADSRQIFDELQKKLAHSTKDRVRKLDAQAYERIKKKMTVVTLSEADRAEWKKVLIPAVKKLANGTFSKELVKRVLEVTGKSHEG